MVSVPDAVVSNIVAQLAKALDQAGITYCHWKSNEAIDRSLSGENDLDLLVDRSQAGRFFGVLADLGFVAAQSPPSKDVPGICDFYGYQEGRPLHVHAHFQLVAGDDATKNFRIPIERAYLASVHPVGLLPQPSPEFEYLVFVIRMVVKHCPWDSLLGRRGRLTASERRELVWLEQRIDRDIVDQLRLQHLPFLRPGVFASGRTALATGSGLAKRAWAGRRMLVALRAHSRRSLTGDVAVKAIRRMVWRWQRLTGTRPTKRRPLGGGLIIGVIGGDGSGKSTTVDHLVRMLSADLATRRLHLGKPPPSLATRAARFLLRRLAPATLHGAFGNILLATDRYRTYMHARRASARGEVVVCDRFPLDRLHTMDAPRSLTGWAQRIEARYYRQLLPPDLLVVLKVDPVTAVARRPEQEPSFVERRAAEIWGTDWPSWAMVIDAGRTLDEVVADVRRRVWGVL